MLVKGWNSPLKLETQQVEDVLVCEAPNSIFPWQGSVTILFGGDSSNSCEKKPTLQPSVTLSGILSIQAGHQPQKVPHLRSASISFWYFWIPEGFEPSQSPRSENLQNMNVTADLQQNTPSGGDLRTSLSKKTQVEVKSYTIYLDCTEVEVIEIANRVREKVLRNTFGLKPILLIHNPNAGPGNKLAFDWTLHHLLGRGLQVQVFTTSRSGDALEQVERLTASREISDFHCVCIWGGDGTIHEVIQGYHQGCLGSSTSGTVPALHLGLFPGGSASALLYTSLQRQNLDLTLTNALYSFCCSLGPRPVALYKFDLDEGTKTGVLFLSVLAGFLADVDFESEVFRCLGSLRFDLYGAFRCLFPKTLQVKTLAYGSRPLEHVQEKLYSVAFLASTSITPTFHFDSPGLSLLPTSNSLVNWLLKSNHPVVRADGPLTIDFGQATTLSIDGEAYRAQKLSVSPILAAQLSVSLLN